MKKRPVIGVLRENKNKWEKRAVLTPNDVKWFVERGIEVEVESSPIRVFKDAEYKKVGAKVVDKAQKASLLVGIKEPHLDDILDDKIYMIFSHTSKGQSYNMPLLKEFLERDVTLVDYEKITDITGRRLVCFGRFAGICGMVDSLYYYGKKLEWKGANNPFSKLKPAWKYHTLPEIKEDMERVRKRIQSKGLPRRIAPFMVGIIGHGHVSAGAQEIIDLLNPVEIRARHIYGIARNRNFANNDVYKIVFLQEEKVTNKKKKGFN
ncbi:MAG: hypothetical protein HQ594_03130, partial [Candidatus Omnitrophica bacterium]|nr:hypothetical protein [Candidatus Omnitrophota bacterium]